jgi:hypothetical protein
MATPFWDNDLQWVVHVGFSMPAKIALANRRGLSSALSPTCGQGAVKNVVDSDGTK